MAIYSLCVVSNLFFASLSERNRYLISRVVSSFCFYYKTHPTRLSHASVFNVMCSVQLGKANTVGDTTAPFSAFIAANFSSMSGLKFVVWSFRSFIFKGATSRAKFCTKRQNTLHMSKKNLSSGMLVRFWSTRIALVMWNAIRDVLGV